MPLLKSRTYTSEDYWNLPEGQRAELIDGQLYDMAPPSRIHQKLCTKLASVIDSYITARKGDCEVYAAPFAVNLDAEDKDWVEPDISVICDKNKLTDRGCSGAPDWIIEIVSPSSRRIDYRQKLVLYEKSGVREYWIVDPERERTTVYHLESDDAPEIYVFDQSIPTELYLDLAITISDLLQ